MFNAPAYLLAISPGFLTISCLVKLHICLQYHEVFLLELARCTCTFACNIKGFSYRNLFDAPTYLLAISRGVLAISCWMHHQICLEYHEVFLLELVRCTCTFACYIKVFSYWDLFEAPAYLLEISRGILTVSF